MLDIYIGLNIEEYLKSGFHYKCKRNTTTTET